MGNKKTAGKKSKESKRNTDKASLTPALPDEDVQYFAGDETGSSPDEDTELFLDGRIPN